MTKPRPRAARPPIRWERQWMLLLMAVPGVLTLLLFNYGPMFGTVVAFQNFKIANGFFGSEFVGLANFRRLFDDPMMPLVIRNTLGLSLLKLLLGFPLPILFALLLNEIRSIRYKRVVQTVSYLPHFVSWLIVIGMFQKLLAVEDGVVNRMLVSFGMDKINFMVQPWFMWPFAILSDMWKETGWNAIIYLAALTSINMDLYEAATVDGAGRFKQLLHVTLPGIRPTIVILLILAVPGVVSSNVDQMWVLGNLAVRDVTEVIDTYVLRTGIGSTQYSLAAAAGLVKSVISVILLVTVNTISKKMGEEGVY
ncbi:ABC transporter permease subunit [Eubacteriales bacterium OttesenSCG-928-N13]|nr:ABC transporter permease subunit [Eubacteriales bacterium OttesenSCG-928-N13]